MFPICRTLDGVLIGSSLDVFRSTLKCCGQPTFPTYRIFNGVFKRFSVWFFVVCSKQLGMDWFANHGGAPSIAGLLYFIHDDDEDELSDDDDHESEEVTAMLVRIAADFTRKQGYQIGRKGAIPNNTINPRHAIHNSLKTRLDSPTPSLSTVDLCLQLSRPHQFCAGTIIRTLIELRVGTGRLVVLGLISLGWTPDLPLYTQTYLHVILVVLGPTSRTTLVRWLHRAA